MLGPEDVLAFWEAFYEGDLLHSVIKQVACTSGRMTES